MAKRDASSRRTTPKGGTGRVTPKGTRSDRPKATDEAATTGSGRYTPPVPREQKVSPRWVPVLMFALWGVGIAIIILNYLGVLPGNADNRFLLLGLALITGGFITATQYH